MHDKQRTKDRRAEKTEALLREALGALIREKSYDDIVVKEILARADVGRSTFYAHFHDKDELLLSGIQDMLRSAQSREGIVWFSLPILEHIEEHRNTGGATMGRRGRQAMHEHLQHAIAELIEGDLRRGLHRSRSRVGRGSPELMVRWIATTFVLVLNWWVENDNRFPAREADRVFRGLIEPTLAEFLT
ncbi:MAG TPA: TetR/AcrR family transcriptional regulator [Burkholderiales bacterium]|nr:TetR/AcrR family transcriptional regulator [Burkholderiales bacterium]